MRFMYNSGAPRRLGEQQRQPLGSSYLLNMGGGGSAVGAAFATPPQPEQATPANMFYPNRKPAQATAGGGGLTHLTLGERKAVVKR